MFYIRRYKNALFNSNTYLLLMPFEKEICLFDVGDITCLDCFLDYHVSRVFITHGHFDHIYGLNKLLERYPDIVVYTSIFGKKSLYSDKLNFSRYHENSFIFEGNNVIELQEGDRIKIGEDMIVAMETPGHDPGCLCYKFGDYFFTGDSFIPGIKTVTNLRGGDKEANQLSLARIRQLITADTVVCPGHGDMVRGCELVF